MQTKFLDYIKSLFSILILVYSINLKAMITTPINTGIDTLKMPESLELKLISKLEDECYQDEFKDSNCVPVTELIMQKDDVIFNFSEMTVEWNSFYSYFVSLKKDKYFLDLNNDGFMEFAIAVMLGERNPVQKVKVFSVYENSISLYGEGKFYWEDGTSVFDIKPKLSK